MHPEIQNYHQQFETEHAQICTTLATIITANLAQSESKIWHGHPVWFLDGNPIVGLQKYCQAQGGIVAPEIVSRHI
jgi:hypothetical protein